VLLGLRYGAAPSVGRMAGLSESGLGSARRPVVGVGAVVFDGDRVLLAQRGNAPNRGLWSLPGGKVEWGETVRAAAQREIQEETGLIVEVGSVVEVIDAFIEPDADSPPFHYVIIDFLARVVGGELRAGDDAAAVRWVAPGEWEALPLTVGLLPVLEKARRLMATPGLGDARGDAV
jgi:8-oxo-dGTP diphosphatase